MFSIPRKTSHVQGVLSEFWHPLEHTAPRIPAHRSSPLFLSFSDGCFRTSPDSTEPVGDYSRFQGVEALSNRSQRIELWEATADAVHPPMAWG